MRFVFALLACLLFAATAHAQSNVIGNCYNGPNSGGTASTYSPCPGVITTTNQSVKITTGLTYQTVLAASVTRHSLTIENNNSSDTCYLIVGTTQITSGTTTTSSNITIAGATVTVAQASITLGANGSYTRYYPFVPSDTIYATCASTGDSLYVDTQ